LARQGRQAQGHHPVGPVGRDGQQGGLDLAGPHHLGAITRVGHVDVEDTAVIAEGRVERG